MKRKFGVTIPVVGEVYYEVLAENETDAYAAAWSRVEREGLPKKRHVMAVHKVTDAVFKEQEAFCFEDLGAEALDE